MMKSTINRATSALLAALVLAAVSTSVWAQSTAPALPSAPPATMPDKPAGPAGGSPAAASPASPSPASPLPASQSPAAATPAPTAKPGPDESAPKSAGTDKAMSNDKPVAKAKKAHKKVNKQASSKDKASGAKDMEKPAN